MGKHYATLHVTWPAWETSFEQIKEIYKNRLKNIPDDDTKDYQQKYCGYWENKRDQLNAAFRVFAKLNKIECFIRDFNEGDTGLMLGYEKPGERIYFPKCFWMIKFTRNGHDTKFDLSSDDFMVINGLEWYLLE